MEKSFNIQDLLHHKSKRHETKPMGFLDKILSKFWILGLGLGFFSQGSKGRSKGPRERERERSSACVVGVCVVRSGVNERDRHYVDPASASPFQQEDCAGICFSAAIWAFTRIGMSYASSVSFLVPFFARFCRSSVLVSCACFAFSFSFCPWLLI
jgi:hypothetical protein